MPSPLTSGATENLGEEIRIACGRKCKASPERILTAQLQWIKYGHKKTGLHIHAAGLQNESFCLECISGAPIAVTIAQ